LTLTGNSPNDSADLKDAVLQPISLNTCGTLTISKVTLAPDGLALQHTTADFEYVLKKGNTVIPVGTTKLAGCANSAPSACTPDSDSYSALSPGNDYSLEEVGTLPGKYLLKSIVCDTFKATSGALTFTVPPSGNVTCTITNQLPAGVMTFSTTPTVKALLYDSAVSIKLEYSIGAGGTKTVTFELFKNSVNCSTESQGTRTATATFANGVDGSASTLPSDGTTNAPPAFLVISPGDTYYWKVTVPGDSKNDPLTKCGEATTVSWSTS
jgi:hypothetical protein